MVGFGEQLRSARESNGLTQKALAEQLYVTRQTVSRWECSERYPDIITLKKISEILSVSLDDLLSGKEMTNVVEKNPVVENKTINTITSVLYALIAMSVFMKIALDMGLLYIHANERFGGYFPLSVELERIILLIIFSYGIYSAVKDTLTPKRIGIILLIYFGAHLLLDGGIRLYSRIPNYSQMLKHAMDPGGEKYGVVSNNPGSYYIMIIRSVFKIVWTTIIPCALGAIASLGFFIRDGKRKLWVNMLTIASGLIILDTVLSFIKYFRMEKFYIINNSIATYDHAIVNTNVFVADFLLGIALSVLIIYQTYTLYRKRRTALDLVNEP
ncbi:XRE family transcriptional regulator [Butyrivibrio sp. XB500-5]|uniref:helix-turn-helix domain-containing protein n=1 Tax=Butyrivibrio sp. XB500-5 TaxID=2364880 RepID=UPI000EA8DD4C|nr:helix-turn-helix transcriptional regulator [Butyrivibrio sp. XB500-5]RKM57674.1 XRE family transcriptional regulator [Butyrivibrio sp. XB500-5]